FYYNYGITIEKFKNLPKPLQLFPTKSEIMKFLDSKERILAVGNMFWFHTFGLLMEYPLERFHDAMNDPLYYSITKAISPRKELITKVDSFAFKDYLAVHWRRGDYYEKCFTKGPGRPKSHRHM